MTHGGRIRVLLLEDVAADAELAERELRRAGVECEAREVTGREEFAAGLATFQPDVVVSDHNLPDFSGRDALVLTLQLAPDVPFILLTGSLDEETAVEYMKAGAADYVLKDRMVRLPAAVLSAIERRRERAQARDMEVRLRDMHDHTPVGILMTTREGRITSANTALARMLGYGRPEDLVGLQMGRDVWWDAADRERMIAGLASEGGGVDLDARWKQRGGSSVWVQLTARAVRDAAGRTTHFEAFVRDVTERKALEQQLLQSQKMEAIGQLAGGVAHDFNNILTAIVGHADLVAHTLEPGDDRREDVDEIRRAAERAAALTRRLLAFSRRQVLDPRVLDLNDVVAGLEPMLHRLLGERITLRTLPATGLGHVRADPAELEQVLMNLVVNARDAMPAGGTITIETLDAELDEAYARDHVSVTAGPHVMLAVSDTGVGMDADTCARIFEPFFTTKAPGQGTGLGLSTVYGIVKQSGGHLWVYSEPGSGTTFKVYLPRVDEPAERAGTGRERAESVGGTETILLVEDTEAVRGVSQRVLERLGYAVLTAADGAEAVRVAAAHRGPIHLVLTDIGLPGMTGREVAERFMLDRPEVRVLYMSGYTAEGVLRQGVLAGTMAYLSKPFTADDLARKVREVLDAARAAR